MAEVCVVVRYRKALTYGVHALLAALETSGADCCVRLGTTTRECAEQVAAAAGAVVVLWSSYSPDAQAMAAELAAVRAATTASAARRVVHVAGGVHAFPSEVRPEHVTPGAMRLLRRYVANDNIIIGAQSGSDRVLAAAGRGHGTAPVRDAVRIAAEHGFRPNVDFIFGMPNESPADQRASLDLAADLAELGARIHAHSFMPLPGTPWRDASPALIPLATMAELDRLAQHGASYGHWRKQAEHSARLAQTARAYPRRARRRRATGRPRTGDA